MVVQCTISSDAQIKSLILEAGIKSEINFRHTAAQHCLVITVYYSIAVYILVEAVTHIGTVLSSMVIQILLCTSNALVYPTIELAYFLAYVGNV